MDWRVDALQSEVRYLRKDVEALKTALMEQEYQKQAASLNRAYLSLHVVIWLVVLGGFAAGFGWI
jgi:hypothetical protein